VRAVVCQAGSFHRFTLWMAKVRAAATASTVGPVVVDEAV
jgi:hypothetical protein